MDKRRAIVIMGMKHTGKSTVGSLLAERLGVPFYDTDGVIAERSGKTARELYDEGGAALMMENETEAVRHLAERCETTGKPCVIATGGGLADNAEAIRTLKKTGVLIYLDTPFELLFARVMESAQRDGRLIGKSPAYSLIELSYPAECTIPHKGVRGLETQHSYQRNP